jgi:ribosome maturation factor RimP
MPTAGKKKHITVLIDKENGATVEDCVKVMRQIINVYAPLHEILRESGIDVATPGLDRLIHTKAHYLQSLYHYLEVKGHEVITEDAKKNIRGHLIACDDESITLECSKDKIYKIPYTLITKSRWVYNPKPYNREKA